MWKFCVLALFHCVSGLFNDSICPEEPMCDCQPNSRMFDIYCVNLTSFDPVSRLLHSNLMSGHPINKLMMKKDCSLTTLPENALYNTSVLAFISSCPFSDIPGSVFSGAKGIYKLVIESTTFSRIPKDLLNLKYLTNLFLQKHKIISISRELWNLTSLRFLSFSRGTLEELSEDAFSNTPFIQSLDLAYNRLEYIHPNSFSSLHSLRSINLRGNKISSVLGLFDHNRPADINLYHNNITSLNGVFGMNMMGLKSLNVGRNPLKNLSSSIFKTKFQYLSTFDMTFIRSTEIDTKLFSFFPKLKDAQMGRNNIQNISKDLFKDLKSLEILNLTNNAIRSVEGIFETTTAMKTLILSFNNISEIKHSFHKLDKLELLLMDQNNIKYISSTDFSELYRLKHLSLASNRIEIMEQRSFSGLRNLESLTLTNNRFRLLNRSLQNLFSLKKLSICSTKLEVIDQEDFLGLTKLSTVKLVHNKIKMLNGKFVDLRSLQIVIMTRNKLVTLSSDVFPELSSLKELWLGTNKLHCDCRLLWMVDWLAKDKSTSRNVLKDNPVCHMPLNLRGKAIKDLRTEDLTQWPEFCPELCHCSCFFDKDQYSHIKLRLNCSNRYLTGMPSLTNVPHFSVDKLGELDLSGNRLKNVSSLRHILPNNLTILNLENNEITSIEMNFPKYLKELKLAGNRLKSLPLSDLSNLNLSGITLANNSWICDCKTTVHFKNWLLYEDDIVTDVYEVRCGYSEPYPKLYGSVIISLKDTELCPASISMYILMAIGLLSFLLLATSFGLAYSRYRLFVKVWLYSHGFTYVKDNEENVEKEFDALVCYHRSDEQFVLTDIVFQLEKKEPKFKLCIPERDFVLGEFSNALEMKTVDNSRRTIVVLTQEYINDPSRMSIFQLAFEVYLDKNVQGLILIKKEDIRKRDDMSPELKVALKSNNCIAYGEPLFWERLRFAMPKRMSKKGVRQQ